MGGDHRIRIGPGGAGKVSDDNGADDKVTAGGYRRVDGLNSTILSIYYEQMCSTNDDSTDEKYDSVQNAGVAGP